MGTVQQKRELASKLLGIPYSDVKRLLNLQGIVSCIYLTILGKVKDLRSDMNIDSSYSDEDFVCKFGTTSNMVDRIQGHKQDYKNMNVNLHLKKICVIDPYYGYKAETELKNSVKKYKLDYDNTKELIVLNEKRMVKVEKLMNSIRSEFGATVKNEMQGIIDNLNHQIQLRDKNIQLHEKTIELKEKTIELHQRTVELRDKTIELLQLKLSLK